MKLKTPFIIAVTLCSTALWSDSQVELEPEKIIVQDSGIYYETEEGKPLKIDSVHYEGGKFYTEEEKINKNAYWSCSGCENLNSCEFDICSDCEKEKEDDSEEEC